MTTFGLESPRVRNFGGCGEMRRRRHRLLAHARTLAALVLFIASACDRPTGLRFPADAVRYEPLAVYAEWWRMVEACSGARGDFSQVRWYHAPRASIVQTFGRQAGAFWTGDGNRILISSDRVGEGRLVRHEMLHALRPVGGHARADFMDRCVGLVSCDGDCLQEAGPAPVPAATVRRISSKSLVAWNEVNPSIPSFAMWGGFYMFTVHVRNPYDEPVVVELPPSGDAGSPLTFQVRTESVGAYGSFNMRADDGAHYVFAPGEQKLMVFDFSHDPRLSHFSLAPGQWKLHGYFGEQEGAPVTVVIAP